MKILALDIGYSNMGWVVHNGKVVGAGVITTEKSQKKSARVADDNAYRSALLARGLTNLVRLYTIKGIVAELPSGGAQNAQAMAKMNMASAITAAVAEILGVPIEYYTPGDVKKSMTGYAGATKEMMMQEAVKRFGGTVTAKSVSCKKSKNFPDGVRQNSKYHLCGQEWPAGAFEHIADACGVIEAARTGVLMRMAG